MKNEKIVSKFSRGSIKSLQENFSKLKPIISGKNSIEQNFIESNLSSLKIKNDEKITEKKYDEKIKNLESKKAQGGFSKISAPLKISFLKNFSKRREINKIKNLQEEQKCSINSWKENPQGILK